MRILLLLLSSLSAQVNQPEREVQRPGQAAQAQKEQLDKAADADEPSFQDILKRPDDVGLNLRYARAQVRRGDVKGASATLERVLMLAPNQPRVRLFYAVVLYRLDNSAEARRELDTILKSNPPADIKAEAEQYVKLLDKRLKKTHFVGRLGTGVDWNSNRNAAPLAGFALFADTPVRATASTRRKSDANYTFLAGLDVKRDLPSAAGHQLTFTGNYYRTDQTKVKTLDLQALSLSGGAILRRQGFELIPEGIFEHIRLAHHTFLRNRGGKMRLQRSRRGTALYAEVKGVYNDYEPTAEVGAAHERRGPVWDTTLGFSRPLLPWVRLDGSYTRTGKFAAKRYNSFVRDALRADATFLTGRGTFVASGISFTGDKYAVPERAVSRHIRHDQAWRFTGTAGLPLKLAHSSLKDFLLIAGYEHLRVYSNIPNFEYFNNRITTMLTYRWEAGF